MVGATGPERPLAAVREICSLLPFAAPLPPLRRDQGATGNCALTISGHADCQALPEAALLAAVPVDPDDGAVLHFKTLLILDVLLDAPPEKTLQGDEGTRESYSG